MVADTPYVRRCLLQQLAYRRIDKLRHLAVIDEAPQDVRDAADTIDCLLDHLDTPALERLTKKLLRPLFEHGDEP